MDGVYIYICCSFYALTLAGLYFCTYWRAANIKLADSCQDFIFKIFSVRDKTVNYVDEYLLLIENNEVMLSSIIIFSCCINCVIR